MAKRSRLEKAKGRLEAGQFIALPKACLNHQNFIALSPHALKLLIDLYSQYNGFNNGDLCCTWSMMKKRSWRSQTTLNEAKKELTYYGWIIPSRIGGKNMATLYAVTFQAINECKGKIELPETSVAPGRWKETKNLTWKEHQKNEKALRNVIQFTPSSGVIRTKHNDKKNKLLQEVEQ